MTTATPDPQHHENAFRGFDESVERALGADMRLVYGMGGGPAAPKRARPQIPIRVVLADDHALVRRSLRLLLAGEANVEVVAEAADLTAAAGHVHGRGPHVLVLDLQVPNGSSLELIRRLREQVPGTEIVVLTMERNPGVARRALDAGAVGFVLKHRADTELPPAIRLAARGQKYVSPYVANGLRRKPGLTDSVTVDSRAQNGRAGER